MAKKIGKRDGGRGLTKGNSTKDCSPLEEVLGAIVDDISGAKVLISEADAAVTAVANAATQTGSYVQADVQSIATLVNDLKAKYNALVALVNEIKTDLNAAKNAAPSVEK